MQEVQIDGGKVILKETLKRKAQREFNRIMFRNSNITEEGKTQIGLSDLDDANDTLLLHMIEKAIIDQKEITVTQDFIDDMSQSDYEKILTRCKEIREKAATLKKK